jgi:hypothetical protein
MRLSAYWSVLLLAVFAVGFLVAGAPVTKEAAAGAGFALAARRSRAWSTSLRSAAVRRRQPRSAAARTSTRHAGLPTWRSSLGIPATTNSSPLSRTSLHTTGCRFPSRGGCPPCHGRQRRHRGRERALASGEYRPHHSKARCRERALTLSDVTVSRLCRGPGTASRLGQPTAHLVSGHYRRRSPAPVGEER